MKPRRQSGVSMVELLVATAVGLFLTAGIIQLFVSSSQAYRSEEGFARLQENGRYALELITRELRMHGNMGCDSMVGVEGGSKLAFNAGNSQTYWGTFNVLANDLLDSTSAFSGSDYLMGSSVPIGFEIGSATNAQQALINPSNTITTKSTTDALWLTGVFQEGVYLASDMAAWTSNVELAANPDSWAQGDFVLITDCRNVDIFEITNDPDGGTTLQHGTSDSTNRSTQLSTTFKADSDMHINAMVYLFTVKSYFIGTANNDGDSVPTLYVSFLNGNGRTTREVVEYVEDIVFTFYGHDDDNNGSPDGYERASSVSDWDEVQGVRVQLLMRSPEQVLLEPKSTNCTWDDDCTWDGTAYSDRYLREVFSTTVALRGQAAWRMNP